MDGLETEKENLSSKIRKRFGWKKKIILEKERENGSGEVTIELPAKHEGMIQDNVEEMDEEAERTETDNELDHSYVEVLTTLTSLFIPDHTNNVIFEDKLKCENSEQFIDNTDQMCDIPVHHVASHTQVLPSYHPLLQGVIQSVLPDRICVC
jgi:hypothetical protein